MHLIELIANNTLTALDLETSGLDHKKDRIIEIGAVKICGWEKSEDGAPKKVKLGETFSTFVSFPGTLPEEISQLTGITEQDLEHAPKIKAALKKLKKFIGDDLLVGHYCEFNDAFLYTWGQKCRVSFDNRRLDTFTIARSVYGDKVKNFSLSALAKLHGIEYSPQRTVDYARITANLLAELARRDDFSHCDT